MDVSQLINLASWYQNNVPSIIGDYQRLQQILEHNATQPQKTPAREPLQALLEGLHKMSFNELTNEEIDKMKDVGVYQYLGEEGVEFVNKTIQSSDFDPASAAADMKAAAEALNSKQQQFQTLNKAFQQLNFHKKFEHADELESLIRIRFQDGAAISDVALWKKWSADWHDIIRGAAMCAKESPSHVRVISASSGSIIMTLAGTTTVTLILVAIVKNIGKIVHEILQVSNAIEDLRHKRILNRTIETELTNKQNELRESGIQQTLNAIKEQHPKLVRGEIETALKKSIEKYLKFNDKGGDVDFIPPKAPKDSDEFADEEGSATFESISSEIRLLQNEIEEVRSMQSEIRLLTLRRDESS